MIREEDVLALQAILQAGSMATARHSLYFLRARYGKRKGVRRLIRCAVAEVTCDQARIELAESMAELENESE